MLVSLSFNTYQQMNNPTFLKSINLHRFIAQRDSLISWSSNRKLTWNDFKGKPNYNEIYAARTYFSILLKPKTYQDSIVVTINNQFEIYNSWIKMKDTTTIFLLDHEQGHFDIAEICARSIRQAVSNSTFKNRESAHRFLNDTYDYQWSLYLKLNALYEKETDHCKNKIKQKEWSEKIAKMLKELDDYSSTKVVVKLTP